MAHRESERATAPLPIRRRKRKPYKFYKSVDSLAQEADDRDSEVAFLPQRVRDYLSKKRNFTQPKCTYSTGAVLFIDISGFTKLGKELGENNDASVAAEKLAETIMSTLKKLTAICIENKGDVVKFAGDALLCVWSSFKETEALCQAKQAGVVMLRMIKELDQGLDLHGGIAFGTLLDIHLVKKSKKSNRSLRWYLLSGSASSLAGELLEKAPKGIILVQSSSHLEKCTFETDIPEESSKRSASSFSDLPPIRTLSQTLPRHLVTSYIPELVLTKLRGGDAVGGEIISNVSVMFVAFDSLVLTKQELADSTVAPSKVKRLNGAFNKLMKLLRNSGGEIRDLLFDDKGCIFIGVFGAHHLTEDPERKAVIAARRVSKSFKTTRIGISAGACYAGLCGTSCRNDFVVMGHEVNQAARFCGQANVGTILVSARVQQRTSANFKFERKEFEKKGQKFECFLLKDEKSFAVEDDIRVCIGRTEERSKILRQISMPTSSNLVLLKGDKGLGKTNLIFSLREDLKDSHDLLYVSAIETEMDSFLFLYKQALLSLLGLKSLTLKEMKAKCKYLNVAFTVRVTKLLNISRGRKTGRLNSLRSSKAGIEVKHQIPSLKLIPQGRVKTNNPKVSNRLNKAKTVGSKKNSSMTFSAAMNSSLHSLASQGIDFLPEAEILLLSKFLGEVIEASLLKSSKQEFLFIVDDLQYCDENSVAILLHFMGSQVASKFSFLCAYRSFNSLSHIIRNRVEDVEGRLMELGHLLVTLDPLSKTEVPPLALHFLETKFSIASPSKAKLSNELLSVFITHTKGMPNFLQLLVKHYYENNMLEFKEEEQVFKFREGMYEKAIENLPKGLAHVAGFHLNSLDGIQKRVLKLAACIGTTFSITKLWKILAKDGVSYSYEDFNAVLETLVQREFLRTQSIRRFSVINRPDLKKSHKREHEYYQFAWSVYQEAILNLIPLARQTEIKEFLADLESLISTGAKSVSSTTSKGLFKRNRF